jgi:hypothetical protein
MKSKLVWITLFIGVSLVAGIRVLSVLNGEEFSSSDLSLAFATLSVQVIALFIVSRRADNVVGWLLLAGSLGMLLSEFTTQYAHYALSIQPGALPLGLLAAWTSTWIWSVMVFAFFILLPLLFPTGRPLSNKWRIVLWFALAELAFAFLTFGLAPGLIEDLEQVRNPLGWEALAPVYEVIEITSTLGFLALIGLALLSVAIRFRLSRGDERAQMKWFLFATSILFLNAFRGITTDLFGLFPPLPQGVEDGIFALNMVLIALAIGVAVLKYRLYDIDVIIRRTLLYGSLTAILALVYFASVLLIQSLIPSLTGQNSQVAIVLSTLFIAALFSPLRLRVQSAIDRRFYRGKYDAEKIIASFSAELQDQVDPGQVTERLISIVQETMQPEDVSIWLPDGNR